MIGRLTENAKLVQMTIPKDITGAAQDSLYVNMALYRRLCIIISQGAWAGGTPAVTLTQSKTSTGGSVKSLSFAQYLTWVGGQTAGNDAVTAVTVTSDTFNLTATANTCYAIEVNAYDLDINGGFTFVNLHIATPGSNADLFAVVGILYDPSYAAKPATMPTGIQ